MAHSHLYDSLASHDLQDGDVLLLWYFCAGMGLGLVMLGVLNYFPGTPSSDTELLTAKVRGALSKNDTNSWHDLPPEELERIRQRFRLTKEQMDKVMKDSKNEAEHGHASSMVATWTPHQTLNRLVYLVLFAILVYVFHRDYGPVVTMWLTQIFPKEANTLGIGLPAYQQEDHCRPHHGDL
jgi:hypothetical protein